MLKSDFSLASLVLALFGALVGFSGCGYGFQGTRSNPWASYGVKKIYVQPLINNTLHSGAEIPFTAALVKEFSRAAGIKVVSNVKEADAILSGVLSSANSIIRSSTPVTATTVDPAAGALSDVLIASEYEASASISLTLQVSKSGTTLWNQSFTSTKIYPGNNRFGAQGATSALINASQEQMALAEIAQVLASDAHDTMLEAF